MIYCEEWCIDGVYGFVVWEKDFEWVECLYLVVVGVVVLDGDEWLKVGFVCGGGVGIGGVVLDGGVVDEVEELMFGLDYCVFVGDVLVLEWLEYLGFIDVFVCGVGVEGCLVVDVVVVVVVLNEEWLEVMVFVIVDGCGVVELVEEGLEVGFVFGVCVDGVGVER